MVKLSILIDDTMGSVSETPAAAGLQIVDRFIDDVRPLRVAVIGGGLSGITAGVLLPAKVPGIQLTIYDKNKDFGGTWLENVYPGVRCDIPSHVYQSTFAPKTDWSDEFAYGAEIRDYWQDIARRHGVYQYARFGQRVEALDWDDAAGTWTVQTRDVDTGATAEAVADVVITAVGRFNDWQLPDYPGLTDYRGQLRHSSHWDPSFAAAGKRVAVIGNGASGIQLVANLQSQVAQLDHYVRHRTWIASSWAGDERTAEPQPIPADLQATFRDDPAAYLAFRKQLEEKYWRRFGTFLRDSPENAEIRQKFVDIMRARVANKPELLDDLIPDFSPNCRRLTPGPGYLEALTQDNVDYIRTPIARFTATGIVTADGRERPVDAVFCATGANVDMVPAFAVRARGKDLRDDWRSTDAGGHGFPYTYFGYATPGFPNLFFLQGPHGSGPSGTVPQSTETHVAHLARILRKLSREGVRSIVPSVRAADDFVAYANAFFARTVLTDHCSSWYNGGHAGGFIHGLWPGSAGHLTTVRREPRWEDFEYTYVGEEENGGNRFAWYFGNGQTRKENDADADLVSYLKLPGQDLRDLHEPWWDL